MGPLSSRRLIPEKKPHRATVDTVKRGFWAHKNILQILLPPPKMFDCSLASPPPYAFISPALSRYLFPCRQSDHFFTKSSTFPHSGELKGPHAAPWGHLPPTLTVLPFLFPLGYLWRQEIPTAPRSCSQGCLCWPQMPYSNKHNSWQLPLSKLKETSLCILMTLIKRL